MSWLDVKLKAGRIVPAMSTTTSVVSGLQTIEMCKVLLNYKVEKMKNSFINLGIPMMVFSNPAPMKKIKIANSL
jgi:hypothetical protein